MAETALWPEELPCPLIASYDGTLDAGVIRSSQRGFARERDRFNRYNTTITLGWTLTSDELAIFKDFFFQDTLAGALRFLIDLKLDAGLETVLARFIADNLPEIAAVESYWSVSAQVEVLNRSQLGSAVLLADLRVTEEGEQRITEEGEERIVG